jgi:hypothetical protein
MYNCAAVEKINNLIFFFLFRREYGIMVEYPTVNQKDVDCRFAPGGITFEAI